MSKTNLDKKVNRTVKAMNKTLKADVFKDRFWFRQIQKQKSDDGMQYYLYELRDRLEPNRNSIVSKGWIWGDSRFLVSDLWEAMNDFIVKSDFWHIYNGSPYDKDMDEYAQEFYHYHSKNI